MSVFWVRSEELTRNNVGWLELKAHGKRVRIEEKAA